jgi:transposase
MKFKYFIGIDVSKQTLDFTVLKDVDKIFHLQTENSYAGIKTFIKKLKAIDSLKLEECLFCLEHTGIYNNPLLEYFEKHKCNVCLESAVHIKQSSGLMRGKNDKIDSYRISLYAYRNRDNLKLWQPKREIIKKLKSLAVTRDRLINAKKQLETALKEGEKYTGRPEQKLYENCCKNSIMGLKKDLHFTEKQIKKIILEDERLNELFNIITSVPGIGIVTATEVIVSTNEFKDIKEGKKYACYSGVAPFGYSSGTSIRGKAKVSNMANKHVKKLLHMAALSAIIYNKELKAYYERKVAEGKNKMAVVNAIRNKLIHRIFSCVRENRKYEETYTHVLA